jgi:flagellar biosynthesis protein FliR
VIDPIGTSVILTAMLVFARVGGLVMALPVFNAQGTPRSVVVFTSLAVTILVVPGVQVVGGPEPELGPLLLSLGGELIIGLILGSSVMAVFAAMAVASELMALQMGLAMASLFNPLHKQPTSPVGTLGSWIAGIVFLITGQHLRCLELIAASFSWAPPGSPAFPVGGAEALVVAVGTAISLGIQLAGPLLALVWMVNVLVAILAKLAPRMNVFLSIGMTASTGVGLILIALALPWLVIAHKEAVEQSIRIVARTLTGI